MYKPIAIAALAVLAAPLIAAPAAGPELQQVQAHLQAVQTMTADFTQTDRAGKVLTGVVTLKRPGKVRFQYEKNVPILIVGDGKSLWFLDYSVGQKSRWPVGQSPLGVLLDPSKDLARFATIVRGGNTNVFSVEARDPKRPEFGRITMIFERSASAPNGLELQGWVALDAQNNRTTVRLTNHRFNLPVSDGTFRFNDPKKGGNRR